MSTIYLEPNQAGRAYTREQAQALYRRVDDWADQAYKRIHAEIFKPVFGDACVMHNSMMAWEEGKPWKCLLSRYPNYYKLGKRFEYESNKISRTRERLGRHFARYF
jgi:hypothetical protein